MEQWWHWASPIGVMISLFITGVVYFVRHTAADEVHFSKIETDMRRLEIEVNRLRDADIVVGSTLTRLVAQMELVLAYVRRQEEREDRERERHN